MKAQKTTRVFVGITLMAFVMEVLLPFMAMGSSRRDDLADGGRA